VFNGVDPDFRTERFHPAHRRCQPDPGRLLTLNGPAKQVENFTPDITLVGKWIYDSLMDGAGIRDKQITSTPRLP
jgi:hypothetical protein